MSEKEKTLVPTKAAETSEEQRELMLLLNEQVCALFAQDDVLLRPSPEMNRNDLWERLKVIPAKPQAHVGYWFGVKIDVSEDGCFWLNIKFTVWVPNGNGSTDLVFLTPNQTHWICDRLKTNALLRKSLTIYVNSIVASLRDGLGRLQTVVDEDKFWEDTTKWNQIFDVVTGSPFRRGLYTSWNIFLEHVCPPPPWAVPDPNLRRQWNQIKAIGGKVPTSGTEALQSLLDSLRGSGRRG